jgi:hypothetical protein
VNPSPKEPAVEHTIHAVGSSASSETEGFTSVTLDDLPPAVVTALREIRDVRDDHLRRLSLADRRKLAAAEHLQARHIDLQAQIDARLA